MQTKSIPQHFKLAFDACALASLNNQLNKGNRFEKEATRLYAKALSATYSALQDPEIATQDTTLASILLFSVFESITATRVDNLAWGTHIEGAIQLVMSRGKNQLRTEIGECLFNSVRAAMVGAVLAPSVSTERTRLTRFASSRLRIALQRGSTRSRGSTGGQTPTREISPPMTASDSPLSQPRSRERSTSYSRQGRGPLIFSKRFPPSLRDAERMTKPAQTGRRTFPITINTRRLAGRTMCPMATTPRPTYIPDVSMLTKTSRS